MKEFINSYLKEVSYIANNLDREEIFSVAKNLFEVRKKNGRVFFLGVGGSAGNASHAVCDLRKITGIECYAPSDNISELTARVNDEGWDTVFSGWLEVSNLSPRDAIFIFSVGGGSLEFNISPGLVKAIDLALTRGSRILGIVGKKDGYTRQKADASILIPIANDQHITPHSESFQTVIWHLFASLPELKLNQTKWESVVK